MIFFFKWKIIISLFFPNCNPLCKLNFSFLVTSKCLLNLGLIHTFVIFTQNVTPFYWTFTKFFHSTKKKIVQLIIFKILIRVQATKGGVFGPKTKVQIFKIPTKIFLLLYYYYTFRLKSLYSRIRPVRKILEPIFLRKCLVVFYIIMWDD